MESFLNQIAESFGTQPLDRFPALFRIHGGYYLPILQLSLSRGVRASFYFPREESRLEASVPASRESTFYKDHGERFKSCCDTD